MDWDGVKTALMKEIVFFVLLIISVIFVVKLFASDTSCKCISVGQEQIIDSETP